MDVDYVKLEFRARMGFQKRFPNYLIHYNKYPKIKFLFLIN
jgi:hypothetical protein